MQPSAGIVNTDGYKKNWFKDWFNEHYLTVYSHRDQEDAEKLLRLIGTKIDLAAKRRILDAGCGNGRHASQLALQNLQVVGLDLSQTLLYSAVYEKADQKYPQYVRGDMRHLPFKACFDVILSLFTSFGYFSEQQNQDVLREYYSALKRTGWLVLDYLNAEHVRQTLIPKSEKLIGSRRVTEHRYISGGRVEKRITIEQNNRLQEYTESVKLYSLQEMEEMLAAADFSIRHVFGSYEGQPFEADSTRMILFCQK